MLEAQVIGVGAAGNKAALELLKNGTVVDKNRIMLINSTPKDIPAEYADMFIQIGSNASLGGCGKEPDIGERICVDALKEGKAIIINLEGMNTDDAQHIIDIIVGCCYTIDGDIKRIAPSVFVAAPHDMEINIREDLLNEVLTPGGNMLDLRNEY